MPDPIYVRIQKNAADFAHKPAIICGEVHLSYAEFFDQVQRWMDKLPGLPGQSVATLLHNCAELLSLMVATSARGLNLQVLSPEWPEAKIRETIKALQPNVVVDEKALSSAELTRNEEVGGRKYRESDYGPGDNELPFYTGFTSGSTGTAKGFVRSEMSWLESFRSDQQLFQFSHDDVFVIPGSLSHSLPLYGAIRGLYQGGTVYLAPRFRPDRIVRDCTDLQATVIYATPTQYRSLIDQARHRDVTLTSMRRVLTAGSKFPPHWLDDLREVFSKSTCYEFYGTSELSYVSAREMVAADAPTSVGLPMQGVHVRILNDHNEIEAPGMAGRVFVKSPFLFMGYLGPQGAVDQSSCEFQDGYLSVGDKGYLDEVGVLNLVGRVDQVFQSSGRNVDPQSIETVIGSAPGVQQCAVLGVHDEKREKRITAILSLEAGVDVKTAVQICKTRLPGYLVPQHFYVCEEWPLTPSYKTDYQKILQLLEGQKIRRVR